MTSRAVGVLCVLIVLRSGRLNGADVVRDAVTGQAKLADRTEAQQPGIGRTVRRVTSRAPFSFERRMLVGEGPLFICVTLNACGICTGS